MTDHPPIVVLLGGPSAEHDVSVVSGTAIAEALAEAGVHRIEAGLPAVSASDAEAVRRIVSMGLPSKIYAFSRCMVDDVKVALDCGVSGVVMEIPSSRHLIELWLPVEPRPCDRPLDRGYKFCPRQRSARLLLPHRRNTGLGRGLSRPR